MNAIPKGQREGGELEPTERSKSGMLAIWCKKSVKECGSTLGPRTGNRVKP